jgi:predicted RNA methylase
LNKEFGDFQTPPALVSTILECLSLSGNVWSRVLEPTCGRGNFIEGLLKQVQPPCEIQAIEIQDTHLDIARRIAEQSLEIRVVIKKAMDVLFPGIAAFGNPSTVFDT